MEIPCFSLFYPDLDNLGVWVDNRIFINLLSDLRDWDGHYFFV